MNTKVVVIGAGLAGCEAALQLANRGIQVTLYEQKPLHKSAAHKMDGFAELVCSNSLKSADKYTASGLLKQELLLMGSVLIKEAFLQAIPAGSALAVDREKFSQTISGLVSNHPNVEVVSQQVKNIDTSVPTIVATGPLTDGDLYKQLGNLCGEQYLNFFDAVSPIVSKASLDFERCFVSDRYKKTVDTKADSLQGVDFGQMSEGQERGSYINCPLTKEEYLAFFEGLVGAERALQKDWEQINHFEGCMPIESIAKRGVDTMRFGPMRPVGVIDPKTDKRPYAVLQLRQENQHGDMYNLVGFQTSLKWGEQKRVFGMIPALKNAEYLRYGVMHKNAYINAPCVLDKSLRMIAHPNVCIVGQLSGVEGYVESIMTGLLGARGLADRLQGKQAIALPMDTICGALIQYVTTPNKNFAPMNANFGLLPQAQARHKEDRKQIYYNNSIASLKKCVL